MKDFTKSLNFNIIAIVNNRYYMTNNNSSSSSTATTTTNETTLDISILNSLLNESYIKNKIEQIKLDDDFKNENDLKVSDRRRSSILDIAEFLEGKMNQNGSPWMVVEISKYIKKMLEKSNLDKHVYLIYEVLPNKYKDNTTTSYKTQYSKTQTNKAKRYIEELSSIDTSQLDPEDLYELKNLSISFPDNCEKQLIVKGYPETMDFGGKKIVEHNPLDDLKRAEKNKFKKASIGEPLATAVKLCEDNPEYAKFYPELVKTLDQMVRAAEIMRTWFTDEFPPLTVEDLKDLTLAFKMLNEYLRPYYDKKYRRDHVQSVKTAYTRVLHTSTKASHESQIACAHYLDKFGLPVMRGLTKEQIDAMYEWEINFNQKFTNTVVQWPQLLSRVNQRHGNRALEDRAIALSGTLQHHA